MHSLIHIDTFSRNNTVVQMARCSFDIHMQEIFGTLTCGGTLIMLHPGGSLDLDYLSRVLHDKQVSYMHAVPSLLRSFFAFLEQSHMQHVLTYMRSLCSSGKRPLLYHMKLCFLFVQVSHSLSS
jgi:non-ribosomal peptide synthetase component F